MHLCLFLLGGLIASATSSPTPSQAEPFQNAQPDQYFNLCQDPYGLDTQKFQDIGLGFTCRGIVGGLDKFTQSYQDILRNHVQGIGEMRCKASEQNPCDGVGPQDIVKDSQGCQKDNALSSAATLCMIQLVNWSSFMADLWMQTGNVWDAVNGRIPEMVTKFLPADQTHNQPNKLAGGGATAGLIGGLLSGLAGAIPPIGLGPVGAAIGAAGALASGVTGVLGSQLVPEELEFEKAAQLSDSMTLMGQKSQSAIAGFMNKVLDQVIDPTGPDGSQHAPMDYSDQPWSIPAMFYYGNWAGSNDSHLPITNGDTAGNNTFDFPTLTKHVNSIAINSLWNQANVFILKASKKGINTASDTPCAPNLGPGYDVNSNKWCDDGGSAYIIMRWLTDDETPEKYDPRKSGSMDAPGVGNLGDYGLDFRDVIKTSWSRQLNTGNFSAGEDAKAFAGTVSQISDMNQMEPEQYLGWNLPVCDLDQIPGDQTSGSKCRDEECYTRMQALCRCNKLSLGPNRWPKPAYKGDTFCDSNEH